MSRAGSAYVCPGDTFVTNTPIYADPGIGGESTRQPQFFAAAGEPKTIWKVPGSSHTGGIDAQPVEYERRVTAFFDAALSGTNRPLERSRP
jgi:hypothetical protein